MLPPAFPLVESGRSDVAVPHRRFESQVALRAVGADFVERERGRVADAASHAPATPDGFIAWLEDKARITASEQELLEHLAERATLFELKWYLDQELLDTLALVDERAALDGLMLALGTNARYRLQSLGALGLATLSAERRAGAIASGMKRLGIPGDVRALFALPGRDAEVSSRDALRALVEGAPETVNALAEGALMRHRAANRCHLRYRREMGFAEPIAHHVLVLAVAG